MVDRIRVLEYATVGVSGERAQKELWRGHDDCIRDDKTIKEVVGRTYANLYQGTLFYKYDGLHITVNGD